MGVPGKLQVDGGVLESDAKKWVTAVDRHKDTETSINDKEEDEEESCSSSITPTGQEARIPTSLTCPPPPMKRKPTMKCNYGGAREFFTPPDLDTNFIRRYV
ncbi:cyclin-dependent protein kinase inhibitor SMR6-like [Hibiscus syriacus]|uniref:cyclin-dependent protein kinase inhibitor SMR6-like n=1 Tax=Hibiscus syriacus TaxID=106335 RepID=UPI001922E9D3|nr:cyclin-dependent protein kinase inhibitor SMR6-like [Hibiscus syriacus]